MIEVMWRNIEAPENGVYTDLYDAPNGERARNMWRNRHDGYPHAIVSVRTRKMLTKDEINMALEHHRNMDEETRFILMSINARLP